MKDAYNLVMKIWSLTPILMSAYLSAMLTSGLAPIRPSVIFAAAIDPVAAQKALQNAVSAVTGGDWAAPTISPAAPLASPVVASIQQPVADPVMTDELMARLLAFAATQDDPGTLGKNICVLLKICDGKTDLSVRQLETGRPKGLLFMIPAAAGSKDVILAYKNPDGSMDAYLTDKTYKLRASVHAGDTYDLVPNEKAAARFKAALSHLAREAAEDLPPTGTAVAGGGNS